MPSERKKTRQGFRWRFRGQYKGVLYHSRLIYSTKQEADRAERLKLAEIEDKLKNPQNIKLFDLMTERLDYIKLQKSLKYYKDNQYFFQRLYKFLGDVNVPEISRKDISGFINSFAKDLKGRGKGNYRVNNCITCLKALFNYGITIYELNMKNPVSGIKKFAEDYKIKRIPADGEIEAVLAVCDIEESLLIRLVMETGARINEALALKPEDIFDGYVILRTRKSENSNRVPRKVPFDTGLLKGFKPFHNRWKEQPRFLEKYVEKLGQKNWGWHNLRHRRASLWAKSKPLHEVMILLGHSSLTTTQRYLQLLS